MSSTTTLPTIAFFGATGDCAGYCLASALKAGHQCIALARTPDKLTASLQKKGVSSSALSQLQIIKGDALDQAAVTKALHVDGQIVDIVVSSLGSVPEFRWSLTAPMRIQNPTLCGDGGQVLVAALQSIEAVKKPLVLVITTTGIQPQGKPRDIPLLYVPLYHWLLATPHADKMKLEASIRQAGAQSAASRAMSGFVLIKATLLLDGESRGMQKVRAGTEDQPALGYFIRRAEVGEWTFQNLIAKRPEASYMNTAVTLTA